jgi:hypothetical protein
MKMTLACFGAVVAAGFAASDGRAQYFYPPPAYYSPPASYCPVRVAPDTCGPYFYCTNGCTWYGPSYCVRPPFEPFNGILPGKGCPPGLPKAPPTPMQFAVEQQQLQQPNVALPINPWTRSPRDYFMWNEAQQERHTRETRPPFVP